MLAITPTATDRDTCHPAIATHAAARPKASEVISASASSVRPNTQLRAG